MAEPQRRKTTTRSFRVDESALKTVESDAAEANVSVNTFVNQILRSYAEFDRYFFKSQRNPLFSDNIGYLVDLFTEEEAAQAGRSIAQNVCRPMILAKYGSMNLGSVLECIRSFAEYGKAYTIYETETAGRITLTLIHSWGRKGSIYLAQAGTALFEMVDLKPKITTTAKTVTISL